MKKLVIGGSIGGILLLLAISFFYKSSEISNVVIDGEGMGIYYLFFEINENVPREDVHLYVDGFLNAGKAALIASLISLFVGISSVVPLFKREEV